MNKLEQVIKERISMLNERYERRLQYSNTEHITESTKEFYKKQADRTKEQITLLQDILITSELNND